MNMLAAHLLNVRYTGTGTIHTITFDATGGTAAGLLTLTDDDGANAFDLGTYTTLTLLIAAIVALDDWEAKTHRGINPGITITTAGLARRAVSSLNSGVALTVPTYYWQPLMAFTNLYETLTASTTSVPVSAIAIDVRQLDLCSVTFDILGADAGATGDVSVPLWGNNPSRGFDADLGREKTLMEALDEDEWTTLAIDEEDVGVALNGATRVRLMKTLDLHGVSFIRIGTITNAHEAVVQFKADLGIEMSSVRS